MAPSKEHTGTELAPASGRIQRVGRYEIHAEIASGGMAAVHLGRLVGPIGFSRTVAIKRLHARYAKEHDFVRMFVDEARLAARIRHPNVVPIVDVVHTDDEIFLVMEFVHGVSLMRLLLLATRDGGQVPVPIAAGIAAGVLHGLHAAHEARGDTGDPLGIVHRDVSPQNVIVGGDGVPRVLDFGIAKARGRLQNTMEGQVKGKLAYMAPEQMGGLEVGREADIYAAGVVLWEMLAGKRLFKATTEMQLFAQVLRGATKSPRDLRPDVPDALNAVVMSALSLDAEERYPTARAFALAIEQALPVASSGQIGSWVDKLAVAILEQTAKVIASVEGSSGTRRHLSGAPAALRELLASDHSETSSVPMLGASDRLTRPSGPTSTEARDARGKRRRPTAMSAVAGCVAGFIVLGSAAMVARSLRDDLPRDTETDRASAYQVPAAPVPSPAEPAPPAPEETAAPAPEAAPSNQPRAKGRPQPPPKRGAAAAAPVSTAPAPAAAPVTAPPKAPAAARPDCDPPYTIDSRGVQSIKPQCL